MKRCGSRRTKLVLPNGINVLYRYDKASRLTNITYQGAVTNRIDYTYDAAGNRVGQASSLSTYNLPSAITNSSYNAANQQLAFGSYRMLYDSNGNVTNIVSGTATNKLLWSSRNQLTNMLGAVTATFGYDGLGRRVARTVSAVQEKYLYDGLDIISQLDGSGNVRGKYFRGLAIDEPWMRTDITPLQGQKTETTNRVYLADALGSIVALTDTNRVITTEYDYQPFGVTTTTGAGNKNSYKFTAREDDGTGLYYYRARYYHPALGRFVSEDPLRLDGGDINFYAYVWNDPVGLLDPWGLAGVQFGRLKLGVGDPWLIFDHSSWGDLGRGLAATADGVIPFADPFSQFYDPCDPIFATSRALGAFSRDLLITAYIPNIGTWAKNPVLYELGQMTLPKAVYETVANLGPIERGSALLSRYGLSGTLRLSYLETTAADWSAAIKQGLTPGYGVLGVAGLHVVDAKTRRCDCN